MKLSELSKKLIKASYEYGDIDVAVQCRDLGGDYMEIDKDIYCCFDPVEKVYLL